MRLLSSIRAALVVIVVFGASSPQVPAGDEKNPRPGEPRNLFDGRTLDGWKPTVGPGVGGVSVHEGAIALGVGNPITGITTSKTDLPTTSYQLSFEARRITGNDFFAAATFPVGESFVTLVGGGWGGSVTGLSMINGASASENETNHYVKFTNGTWYAFEIQVTDRVIRCRIDGAEVFRFATQDAQIKTRIEMRVNQPLGFASYRSSGEIRKVQVQKLTPAQIAEAEAKLDQD